MYYKSKLELASFPEIATWLSWRPLRVTQHFSVVCEEKLWKIGKIFFSPYLNTLEENTKGLYVDRKTTLFEYHIVKIA